MGGIDNKTDQKQVIPRDTERDFPLLEVQNFDVGFNSLILSEQTKNQIERIVTEFKSADILAGYNLKHKKKILWIIEIV